jgi:methionyl-tRNA formyltransferase
LQPEKLKTAEFEQQIRELKPDMQIVMAYRMIPESIYSIAPYGTFNLHTSLLPQYRGAAPINRAIMNGETQSGITTFLLNDKVDCGKIIHSQPIEITERMTAGELHDEMMRLSPMLIEKTISTLLSENPKLEEQTIAESEELKTAPKLFKPDMLIDWTWSGKRIIDHIRGLSPYPAAWINDMPTLHPLASVLKGAKVYKASITHVSEQKGHIIVPCAEGYIDLLELQLPGKKRMGAPALLNGLKNK